MNRVRVLAHAKINLGLEVLGRRPDGYHEVRTVMQSVSLADELVMRHADSLTLQCDDPDLEVESNLVLRAAHALRDAAAMATGGRGVLPGATMMLRKRIPVASGLGGASADAAAALVGLAALWQLRLSTAELLPLASELGADVPFFLIGGTVLATGRGDVVHTLPDIPPTWLVILVPPHSISAKTAVAYQQLTAAHWSRGLRTAQLAEAISSGQPLRDDLLLNSFEAVADELFPGLSSYRDAMLRAGCHATHLSGAGPAIYGLFHSEAAAGVVAERLVRDGHSPFLVRTLQGHEARPRPVLDDD